MSDTEPLLFTVSLGALRPNCEASEELLAQLGQGQVVTIQVKKARGNVLRLRWYWKMLRLFLDNAGDLFDGQMKPEHLHKWLKRSFGLATPIKSKKTGETIDWDYGSIAFHNMPESERAPFVDFASKTLSERLGVDMDTLKQEAQQ